MPVPVPVPVEEEMPSPHFIVGLLVIAIAAGIVVVLVVVLWWRQKKWVLYFSVYSDGSKRWSKNRLESKSNGHDGIDGSNPSNTIVEA